MGEASQRARELLASLFPADSLLALQIRAGTHDDDEELTPLEAMRAIDKALTEERAAVVEEAIKIVERHSYGTKQRALRGIVRSDETERLVARIRALAS